MNELVVLEMRPQPLLRGQLTSHIEQRVPRSLSNAGAHARRLCPLHAGYEHAGLLRRGSSLEDDRKACADRYTDEQLQRKVRNPPVHDLADRGLGNRQRTRSLALILSLTLDESGDLQGKVAPQSLYRGVVRVHGRGLYPIRYEYANLI
jgi:hypothetical protein